MREVLLVLLLTFFVLPDMVPQDFKIELKGYVGVNASVNSRVSVEARNRHIYLYPLPELLNDAGEDERDKSQFDLDAADSRFGLHITGPELKGFKTSAVVEGDFLGKGNVDNNFRLRHAFMNFPP